MFRNLKIAMERGEKERGEKEIGEEQGNMDTWEKMI